MSSGSLIAKANGAIHPAESADRRAIHLVLRAGLLVVAAGLPLVVIPGLDLPFSTPKLIILVAFAGAGLALAPKQIWNGWLSLPAPAQSVLLAWTSALAVSSLLGQWVSSRALLLHIGAVVWFLLVRGLCSRTEALARALICSAAGVALIATLQFMGLDPFGLLGWMPSVAGAARMKVYGTLGNPNFVGAYLAGIIPLTFAMSGESERQRRWVGALLALQIAALLATGSRGALLGLGGAAVWFFVQRARVRWRAAVVLVLLFAATALLLAGDRPLDRAIQGRLYVGQVVRSGVGECALLGCGPGAFEAKYAAWETAWWRENPSATQDLRFAGLQNHAHNDYVEVLVEEGALGFAALLGLIAVPLALTSRNRFKGRDPIEEGASAGIVALAAMALVDFPFARPETLFLFWTLSALVLACLPSGEAHGARATAEVMR